MQREQKQRGRVLTHRAECLSASPWVSINTLPGKAASPRCPSAFVATAGSLCSLSNLLICVLGFSEGQGEHGTWLGTATEGAIFRVPHAARISSRAKGWVSGSVEDAICRGLPFTQLDAGRRHSSSGVFLVVLSLLLPRASGAAEAQGWGAHSCLGTAGSEKPEAFLGMVNSRWPSMGNTWDGNRNHGAETWEEGVASRGSFPTVEFCPEETEAVSMTYLVLAQQGWELKSLGAIGQF